MAAATKAVEASDIIEDVQDIVQDTTELAELTTKWVIASPRLLVIGALIAGATIGSAATYLIVRKRIFDKFQQEANDEIASVKEKYSILNKIGDNNDLEQLASRYPDEEKLAERAVVEDIIEDQGYKSYNKIPTGTVISTNPVLATDASVDLNVFESEQPDAYFVFAEEWERRAAHPDDPFVITKDEFDENGTDFSQASLTYYDGDDVLADEKDTPIDNVDNVVGFENLLRFGHGSGDPNVVFIRNPQLGIDFEMTHSDGKFAKEVLGFDDSELRHSDRRPIRKFRSSDE